MARPSASFKAKLADPVASRPSAEGRSPPPLGLHAVSEVNPLNVKASIVILPTVLVIVCFASEQCLVCVGYESPRSRPAAAVAAVAVIATDSKAQAVTRPSPGRGETSAPRGN